MDLLTSYNGQYITYDEIGNLLNYRDDMSFTWNGRQLEVVNIKKIVITIMSFVALVAIGIIIFVLIYEAEKFAMEEYKNCSIAYWKDGKVATAMVSDEDGKNIYEILKKYGVKVIQ